MYFKAKIKNFVYSFLNLLSPFSIAKASILMYHAVDSSGVLFSVSPEDFEWQMSYLKKNNFQVISLPVLIELLSEKKPIPKKTVVLTFDDGYENNYFEAFPVLKKYNFPATVFLSAGFIGDYYFSKSQNIKFKMLAWRETKEMHDSGLIDFEPHGMRHQKLGKTPLKEAEQEIIESKKIIEEKLGKECRFFSYPYGSYNKDTTEILKRNNFLAAFTVAKGFVKSDGDQNLLELPRNFIHHDCGKEEFQSIAGLSLVII